MSLSKFNVWREAAGNQPIGNEPIDPAEQKQLNDFKNDPETKKLSSSAQRILSTLNTKMKTFTKNPKVMELFLKELIQSVMDAAGVAQVSQGVRTGVMNTLKGQG